MKITDFGIAWSARSVALTQTGQVLGTPQYLSPEQAEGRHASPASDVYALGLIGYECLTGHPAFDGENAVTIALKQVREEPEPLPDVLPARVRTLIRRALAKDPAQRFPDGAAFLAAVEAVRERAGRSTRRRPPSSRPAVDASADPSRARTRPDPARPPVAGPPSPGAGGRVPAAAPARRMRSRIAVVLLPLLGLLAGAGIAAMVLQGLAGNGNPPAEAAAQLQDAPSCSTRTTSSAGRPTRWPCSWPRWASPCSARPARARTPTPGTVIGIQPTGQRLEPGATVRIVVATAPGGSGDSSGSGTSDDADVTSAITGGTPAESSAPPEDEARRQRGAHRHRHRRQRGSGRGHVRPVVRSGADAERRPRPTPRSPRSRSVTTEPSAPASSSAAASSSAQSAGTVASGSTAAE